VLYLHVGCRYDKSKNVKLQCWCYSIHRCIENYFTIHIDFVQSVQSGGLNWRKKAVYCQSSPNDTFRALNFLHAFLYWFVCRMMLTYIIWSKIYHTHKIQCGQHNYKQKRIQKLFEDHTNMHTNVHIPMNVHQYIYSSYWCFEKKFCLNLN
jgi:hypothetical protein